MPATRELDDGVLLHVDTPKVDVLVLLLVPDRAVSPRVGVDGWPDVDARLRVQVELGGARLAVHERLRRRAEDQQTARLELVQAEVDHRRRLGRVGVRRHRVVACLDHVAERLGEVVLTQVRRRRERRVGRRNRVEEVHLRVSHALVHVARRELQPLLRAEHEVAHALALVRRMRVHAEDLDLAMRRPRARADLVQRARDAHLRVVRDAACERELRRFVDRDVDVLVARVLRRRAQFEQVEDEQLARLRHGVVPGRDLDRERPPAHLRRLAGAAALLREELDVLDGDQPRRERARCAQVLDHDRQRGVAADDVLPPQERRAPERRQLAHAHRAHRRRVGRLDHELRVARRVQREQLAHLGRVGDGLHLEPPEIGLGHEHLDDQSARRLEHARLARVPVDAVAVLAVLRRLREDDRHRQLGGVLAATQHRLLRVDAHAAQRVEVAPLTLERGTVAAQPDLAGVGHAARARDRAVERAAAARAVGRAIVHERRHQVVGSAQLHAGQDDGVAQAVECHQGRTAARACVTGRGGIRLAGVRCMRGLACDSGCIPMLCSGACTPECAGCGRARRLRGLRRDSLDGKPEKHVDDRVDLDRQHRTHLEHRRLDRCQAEAVHRYSQLDHHLLDQRLEHRPHLHREQPQRDDRVCRDVVADVLDDHAHHHVRHAPGAVGDLGQHLGDDAVAERLRHLALDHALLPLGLEQPARDVLRGAQASRARAPPSLHRVVVARLLRNRARRRGKARLADDHLSARRAPARERRDDARVRVPGGHVDRPRRQLLLLRRRPRGTWGGRRASRGERRPRRRRRVGDAALEHEYPRVGLVERRLLRRQPLLQLRELDLRRGHLRRRASRQPRHAR